MNSLRISKSKATVVVGLDFGTTFSGFAYARTSKPEECQLFFEWPGGEAAASNYCKTQSSLLYSSAAGGIFGSKSYVLQGWGHEALVQHAQGKQPQQKILEDLGNRNRSCGKKNIKMIENTSSRESAYFITRFKLHLAGSGQTSAPGLPNGLSPRRTISDYLRKLSELIINVLQENLGNHITMGDVQWCITVPAIWNEEAKQEMKTCAEIASLVQGPHCKGLDASPHPAIIVLEPEAASFYCQEKSDFPLSDGDKFLVVDAGGGTVDLALHEKVGPPWSKKVREVAPSSGGLCGGTYVDDAFSKFLSQKIGCFRKFAKEQPETILKLQPTWESIKCSFDGNIQLNYQLELPPKLARAWEEDDASKTGLPNAVASYDSIELTFKDMRGIFDPVVDQILELIKDQMIPDLKAVMVVGGFSASPYLQKRIKETFSHRLAPGTIIFPKEPGSAICCGAVAFGIGGSDLVMSRISKKTYGIASSRLFRSGDPVHLAFPNYNGHLYCGRVFQVFTVKGETVSAGSCVSHRFCQIDIDQTRSKVTMFSTSDTNPSYVTDLGTREEGSFYVSHPSRVELGKVPEIEVSMYFGRTTVEVKAVGANFGDGEHFVMPPVTFERSFERLSL